MAANNFTEATSKTLNAAVELATSKGHALVEPAHVAAKLFASGELGDRVAKKAGADAAALRDRLAAAVDARPAQSPRPPSASPSTDLRKALESAAKIAEKQGDTLIAQDTLALALFDDRKVKQAVGDVASMREAIKTMRCGRKVDSEHAESSFDALEKYGYDLVAAAADGKIDPVVGRDDEIRRAVQILARRTKNNPCLVGEPGVGKTAIAEGLALRIVEDDVPESLRGVGLRTLDLGALVAGAKYRGEFEERLKSVLAEVKAAPAPGVILFIDEIHTVLGAGKTDGAMDAANLLKPLLARGELRVVGATTCDESQVSSSSSANARAVLRPPLAQPARQRHVAVRHGGHGELARRLLQQLVSGDGIAHRHRSGDRLRREHEGCDGDAGQQRHDDLLNHLHADAVHAHGAEPGRADDRGAHAGGRREPGR